MIYYIACSLCQASMATCANAQNCVFEWLKREEQGGRKPPNICNNESIYACDNKLVVSTYSKVLCVVFNGFLYHKALL